MKPTEVYMVVRQDSTPAPSYAPRSIEVRSKKFWSRAEAMKLARQHLARGTDVKVYRAEIRWEEVPHEETDGE